VSGLGVYEISAGTFASVGSWRGVFEPTTTTQAMERKCAQKKTHRHLSLLYHHPKSQKIRNLHTNTPSNRNLQEK